jgi:hypothetical protein
MGDSARILFGDAMGDSEPDIPPPQYLTRGRRLGVLRHLTRFLRRGMVGGRLASRANDRVDPVAGGSRYDHRLDDGRACLSLGTSPVRVGFPPELPRINARHCLSRWRTCCTRRRRAGVGTGRRARRVPNVVRDSVPADQRLVDPISSDTPSRLNREGSSGFVGEIPRAP